MGFIDDVKKNGVAELESDAKSNKFVVGQGVFEGKLLSVVNHTSKRGNLGYKVSFRPSGKYCPPGMEISDISSPKH